MADPGLGLKLKMELVLWSSLRLGDLARDAFDFFSFGLTGSERCMQKNRGKYEVGK
jgi:hypothetical protein